MDARALILTFVFCFLASCGSTVQKINDDVDLNLAADKGYLLIGIDTKIDLKSIHIDGPRNLVLGHKDVDKDADFILVDARAGKYSFDKIRLNRYWRVELEDDEVSWDFEIKPNQISYVGDLEISNRYFWIPSRVELINRSSDALEFMEDKFPTILNSREIIYTGPGNDQFFDYLKTLQVEAE